MLFSTRTLDMTSGMKIMHIRRLSLNDRRKRVHDKDENNFMATRHLLHQLFLTPLYG